MNPTEHGELNAWLSRKLEQLSGNSGEVLDPRHPLAPLGVQPPEERCPARAAIQDFRCVVEQ
jgi:hypothetical protein